MRHLRTSKTKGPELTRDVAAMGYKQELKRNFTMIEIFGIAFSIMGLLPSIASTLTYSVSLSVNLMMQISELTV